LLFLSLLRSRAFSSQYSTQCHSGPLDDSHLV
jgi:hypothetical protein